MIIELLFYFFATSFGVFTLLAAFNLIIEKDKKYIQEHAKDSNKK